MSLGKVIKFIIACLIIGMILAALGATPSNFLAWWGDVLEWAGEKLSGFIDWGGGYILLGAMFLIPIMVIRWLMKGRSKE